MRFLVCLLALLGLAPTFAFAQGVVLLRKGYVQLNGRAVEVGDSYRSATSAETEAESLLRITFAEASFVHAGPKTKFSAITNSDSTVVNLASGWVWVRAGQDRLVTVIFGNTRAEAQGADFIFISGEQPHVLVLEGSVRFADGGRFEVLDGRALKGPDLPFLSELSTGDGAAIAVERKFLYDLSSRLGLVGVSGIVHQGVTLENAQREGRHEDWSVAAGLMLRANYKDGQLDGLYQAFHGDGRPESAGAYRRGLRQGSWTAYYDNGQIADEGEYREGRRIGLWKFYSYSGRLVRNWDFSTMGESAIPRWQWGFSYYGTFQQQGSYQSAAGLVTRCFWCDSPVAPRFEVVATWLKLQEESTGVALGAHLGLDFVVGPVIARLWGGGEYLVREPLRTSVGVELTRAVGRDMHLRDWQPFVRYSMIEMGAKSDISVIQAGLWLGF